MKIPPSTICGTIGATTLLALSIGCSRSFYRQRADRDVYGAIAGKSAMINPGALPTNASIDPSPESRFYDPFDPDHPPMPPDDPVSHELMERVDGKRGAAEWRKAGNPDVVENEVWRKFLPVDRSGLVVLDLKSAVRLGIQSSRDFQDQREDLYLSALDVTYQRFQFSPRLAFGSGSRFDVNGKFQGVKPSDEITPLASSKTEKQSLLALTDGSVHWLAASGGEMLAGFANSLVWDFNGDSVSHATSSLLNFSVVQPLLRLGGRARTLEHLTQSERKLLSNVRQMEQFQHGFYVQVAAGRNSGEGPARTGDVGAAGLGLIAGTPGGRTGAPRADGFMGLLEEQQRIRNLESNVARLRQSLDQLAAAFDAGRLSSRLQVDQARQALFNGQSSLLSSRAAYQTRLDGYKMGLGLPPNLPVVVRDSLLDRFNPSDSSATALDERLEKIQDVVRNRDKIANHDDLRAIWAKIKAMEGPLRGLLKVAQQDLTELRRVLPARKAQLAHLRSESGAASLSLEPERLDPAALDKTLTNLQTRVGQQASDLEANLSELRKYETEMQGLELEAARARLSEIAADFSGLLLALSLDQTATRLESALLPPTDLNEGRAMEIARENRLDWMSARARLVDAWRQVGYTANPLMGGVNIVAEGTMGTLRNDPTQFDGRSGLLKMGLRFDSPLNRLAERNDYREALVDYQRSRRNFMLFEDRISQSVRNTLRIIQLSELNFELRRAAVQVAIAQVDLARLRLDEPPRPGAQAQIGATTARDLVSALSDLLDAQNDFLSLQVGYDVLRLVLDFELGTMRTNSEGLWVDPGAITAKSVTAHLSKWTEVGPKNLSQGPKLAFRQGLPSVR